MDDGKVLRCQYVVQLWKCALSIMAWKYFSHLWCFLRGIHHRITYKASTVELWYFPLDNHNQLLNRRSTCCWFEMPWQQSEVSIRVSVCCVFLLIRHQQVLCLSSYFISMAQCKTAVSVLLLHWRYCSLALSYRFHFVAFKAIFVSW